MKKILFFLVLATIILSGTIAQEPINITQDSLRIGNNLVPGISVNIPEAGYETTLKDWIKIQQSGTKSTVVTENEEMTIFGAIIKDISANPVNIYSKLSGKDSALNLQVAIELKKDLFIEKSSGEDEFLKARNFLHNFARDEYIGIVNQQVKAEEKKLRDLEKELSSLQRNQAGMEKSARSGYKTISSEKEKLIGLNNELTSLSAAILEHNSQLSRMPDGDVKDEKTDYVKDLEKQKKKTTRAIKSSEKKISKAENVINKTQRDLPKNDRYQGKAQDQLSDQEAVLQRYVDKLNTIKGYK